MSLEIDFWELRIASNISLVSLSGPGFVSRHHTVVIANSAMHTSEVKEKVLGVAEQ